MTRGVVAHAYAPPLPDRELTVLSRDGSPLHVEIHGPGSGQDDGAPVVVLSHGWTCSTAFWAAQVRALRSDHRVVVYDQRGHGRSPASAVCSTDVLADDLEAVLAGTLAAGERALVVGHSMGAMTVLAAARRAVFRERVVGAVLCNTGSSRLVDEATVVPLPGGRVRAWVSERILGSGVPLGPVNPVGKRVLRYATMGAGAAPEAVEACARIVHACPSRVRQDWGRVLASLQLDELVRELDVPVAVVAGAADRLTPPLHARAIADALSNCVGVTELAGVGHMGPVESPAAVTAVIRELSLRYCQLKEEGA